MEGVGGVEFVGVGEVRDVTDKRGDVIVVIGKGLNNEEAISMEIGGSKISSLLAHAGWRLASAVKSLA